MQTIVCPIALAGSIVLTGLSSVFAAVVDFPNADSSGDLSSAAAWGGTLPATTDTIQLDTSYGQTLTFGQSCTFDTLLFKGDKTSNTIEISDPSVVVTLSGTENAEPGIRTVTKTTSAALTLKGGTYDLNGKGVLTASAATDSGNNSNSGCMLTLDGVVVSNAASVSVVNARDAGSCKLVLTNGTHVYATKADRFMNSYSITRAATGIVAGGSTLTITGGSFNPFYNYVTGGLLLVTGEGSVISNASTSSDNLFYTNPKQCVIRVEKGGEFDARSPSICYSGGNNNSIEVSSGGLVRFYGGDVSFPYSPSVTGMALKIFEDGTFSSAKTLTLQQTENQILVSNGTFDATLQICGTRNAVRVLGPKARYVPQLSRLFSSNAKDCLLEFGEGATWSISYPYLTATGASGNTLSVVRDATVTFGNFNGFSYNANSLSGYTIRIADGGKIVCKAPTGHADWNSYQITGYDNATVISNGTLDVEGDLRLGEASSNVAAEKGETNTRNSLVFQGQAPLLKVGGDARLSRGTCIRFEVPKGGYSDKAVVWTARQLYTQEGDPMRLELTGLDVDYVKGLESSFDVTLIKTTGYSVNNVSGALGTQVAALAQTMPPRVRLYIAADGRELHLAAKPYRGMTLIVR